MNMELGLTFNEEKTSLPVLASTAQAGAWTTERFLEFFAANIRNPNTRLAYVRAGRDFFRWIEARGITLAAIRPLHVATYIEGLSARAVPSLKQKLAAIRMLFDWLVTGGVLPMNPVVAVHGPRCVVKVGKTSVLTAREARILLDSIPRDNIIRPRDRALIGVLYEQHRLKIWKEFWGECDFQSSVDSSLTGSYSKSMPYGSQVGLVSTNADAERNRATSGWSAYREPVR